MSPGRLDLLLGIPWLGKRVGRKILAGLDLDQVEMAGSGSAPIPAEPIACYRKLGLNLLEGYVGVPVRQRAGTDQRTGRDPCHVALFA